MEGLFSVTWVVPIPPFLAFLAILLFLNRNKARQRTSCDWRRRTQFTVGLGHRLLLILPQPFRRTPD